MSTQTNHLGLHQWEPEDNFLRTDFNGDFAKIDAGVKSVDAAVKAVDARVNTVDAAVKAVDTKVNTVDTKVKAVDTAVKAADAGVKEAKAQAGAAQTLANNVCVSGSALITNYREDITVELGFRPKLVIYGMYGDKYKFITLYIEGLTFTCHATHSALPAFGIGRSPEITGTGFVIDHNSWSTTADENTTRVHYVAFR